MLGEKAFGLRLFDGSVLVAMLVVLTGAPGRAELPPQQRAALLESSRIGDGVAEVLEGADRARDP